MTDVEVRGGRFFQYSEPMQSAGHLSGRTPRCERTKHREKFFLSVCTHVPCVREYRQGLDSVAFFLLMFLHDTVMTDLSLIVVGTLFFFFFFFRGTLPGTSLE